jgi:hypothetical protein
MSEVGHFASVAFASDEEPNNAGGVAIPIYRGFGTTVRYLGLES